MTSRWEQRGIPNPGSDEAVDRGCMCAVYDNYHGRGFSDGKELMFWITEGCPLHWHVEDTAPL